MKEIKVLVGDDYEIVRYALVEYFNKQPDIHVVGVAKDGAETLSLLEQKKPEVVLSGIKMKEVDGFQCALILKQEHPSIKHIILSPFKDIFVVKRMMKLKVDGFVLNNAKLETIGTAVREVTEGRRFFDEGVLDVMFKSISDTTEKSDKKDRLTEREMQVLSLVCQDYSVRFIAKKLGVGLGYINNVKRNLLEKTESQNDTELTRFFMETQKFVY